jgi:hypothetical protein
MDDRQLRRPRRLAVIAPKSSARNPLAGWKTYGLPAFATALAPWLDKLTQAELIPDAYATSLRPLTNLVGPLVCFVLWIVGERLSRKRQIFLCVSSMATFFACIAACMTLSNILDEYWFPGELMNAIIPVAWRMIYLLMFATLASSIVTGLLIAEDK